jgi:hypothetical protein
MAVRDGSVTNASVAVGCGRGSRAAWVKLVRSLTSAVSASVQVQ